jgi:hypothetical protein
MSDTSEALDSWGHHVKITQNGFKRRQAWIVKYHKALRMENEGNAQLFYLIVGSVARSSMRGVGVYRSKTKTL